MPRRAIDVDKRIIKALRENGPMGWTDLEAAAKISRGALHAHLKTLIESNIVQTRIQDSRPPRTIYYLAAHYYKDIITYYLLDALNEIKEISGLSNNPDFGLAEFELNDDGKGEFKENVLEIPLVFSGFVSAEDIVSDYFSEDKSRKPLRYSFPPVEGFQDIGIIIRIPIEKARLFEDSP